MKKIARIICLVLACLFCLLTVVACDPSDNGGKNGGNATVKTDKDGVRWAADEWGVWREYDNLPDELDYNNETITFLYWTGNIRAEFAQSEEVDDARLSAIYKRNQAIQDRLGVDFEFISEPGDNEHRTTFISRVQRAKDSNTHDFDLIGSYAPIAGAMLQTGLLKNITAIENNYIELAKPWWPKNLTHNLAISNNLYFVSGDCSTTAIDQMHCFFFNKDLVNERYEQDAEDYFASNPHVKTPEGGAEGGNTATNMIYEKAYAGKWTLDELIYLASDAYVDKYGDGATVDDQYGLCAYNNTMSALYGAANLRMVETTTDGSVLKISDDWTSTKTVRLVAKLYTLFGTNSLHNNVTTGKAWSAPFNNGTALFELGYMQYAETSLVNNDKVENYGILPCPKYDLNQKNYYTVIGNQFSIYSIFIDCDSRGDLNETYSMLTAVIECWSSEAYRKTTPVIFEMNMKLKSSPTQCEADMCEIIRASIEVDIARVIRGALAGNPNSAYQPDYQVMYAAQAGTAWTSQYSADLQRITKNLADFVETLRSTLVDVK